MKYIYTLFIALGLTAATKLYANDNLVSVMINKQTYQFDRPIRLSSVLSIVADNGDWYWPSASAFDLANPKVCSFIKMRRQKLKTNELCYKNKKSR